MKNLWNSTDAKACGRDPLSLRVYTSRLLGQEPSLVLHGGGNTSVKVKLTDFFGDEQDVLYIKGSGWDLATIEKGGFAPVRLDVLKRMARLPQLTDSDMVRQQRAAMLDPNAPTPSVEAILHAIIPFKYVDHSHSDAVVTITNTPRGKDHIRKIYGQSVLIVDYVMPGFVLAKKVYEMTRGLDWQKCEGIVLLNHGLFTFADNARTSYENHIRLVTKAESYISRHKIQIARAKPRAVNWIDLARIRQTVSRVMGTAVVAHFKQNPLSTGFASLANVSSIATRGTLTPDHVIRTKPKPVIIAANPRTEVDTYAKNYQRYFQRQTNGTLQMLDPAPRWAVWQGQGLITFGRSFQDAMITSDIVDHTISAIQTSEGMGGWKVLSEKNIFEIEYWELEQAKLSKAGKPLPLQGRIALVTGAASGIGKACVETLLAQGAHVAALDIDNNVIHQFKSPNALGLVCDMTKTPQIDRAVTRVVQQFGGLDIVVSNAGIFPPSQTLEQMEERIWDKSLAINLTSHQRLLTASVPYLRCGIHPTFIIIGSKNVPAPGPGAGAYSVAKAGLTQMARVAALELGPAGIRVNVIHPNQVFDTAIWSKDVLKKRASSYHMSVEEYKTNNVLRTQITSRNVAEMVCAMAGSVFEQTTGAQVPIDGGNERVI